MSGENVLGAIFQNANGSTVFFYKYRFLYDLIIVKKQSEKRCQHIGKPFLGYTIMCFFNLTNYHIL